MKIILREDVESLGAAGETVNVKDGFARNYLIPKKLAYPATRSYSRMYEEEKKLKDSRDARVTAQAEETAAKLGNLSLEASVKVGEEDKVFGAVTAADIAELLKDKGYYDSVYFPRGYIELLRYVSFKDDETLATA